MLVEDDPVIGDATQLHLERHDCEVTWVDDGLETRHAFCSPGCATSYDAPGSRARGNRAGSTVVDPGPVSTYGDLTVDRHALEVRREGRLMPLTPTELRLLLELAKTSTGLGPPDLDNGQPRGAKPPPAATLTPPGAARKIAISTSPSRSPVQ